MRQYIAKNMQILTNGLVFAEKTSGATKSRILLEQVRFSLISFSSLHDYSCIVGRDMNYRLLLLIHTLTHSGCDLNNNLSTVRDLWPSPVGYILQFSSPQDVWAESLTIDCFDTLLSRLSMAVLPFPENTNSQKPKKRYNIPVLCVEFIISGKVCISDIKYVTFCLLIKHWVFFDLG